LTNWCAVINRFILFSSKNLFSLFFPYLTIKPFLNLSLSILASILSISSQYSLHNRSITFNCSLLLTFWTTSEINLKSQVNFDLYGIGIPKILYNNDNTVKINIYEEGSLLGEITNFENKDNLSLGILDSGPIEIEKFHEYVIELKGIENLDYIHDEEKYNDNTKIDIDSDSTMTILTCLIIK
jgi:hypothetical protein